MARKKKIDLKLKKLNRYFMITKVFLALTPLICYLYISLKASMNAMSFQEVLSQDPSITVISLYCLPSSINSKEFNQRKYKICNYKYGITVDSTSLNNEFILFHYVVICFLSSYSIL